MSGVIAPPNFAGIALRFVPLRGDGSDESATIQAALNASGTAGGGVVYLPANMTIRATGLTIPTGVVLFIPPTTILKNTDAAHGGIISATNASRIGITGGGTIDCNEANVAQTNGVAAPAAPSTATLALTGNVDTGVHYYRIVAVSTFGRTLVGPASLILTVTTGHQQVAVSSVNVGAAGTTAREIYRTLKDAPPTDPVYLVGTINDNTTTTFTDNVSDANLGAVGPTYSTDGMTAITLTNVDHFTLSDLTVKNARSTGLSLTTNTNTGVVKGLVFDTCGNDCFIAIRNVSNIRVSDCYSTNSGATLTPLSGAPQRNGYEVADDCRNIAFVNCIAEYCADAGFGLHNHGSTDPQGNTGGPYNITLSGCQARKTGYSSAGVQTNTNSRAKGFDILAQGPNGPDGITLSGCVATGGDYGFSILESSAGGNGGLGSVALVGCVAGGYYTSGTVNYPETGTIGTADSPTTYGYYVLIETSTARAITISGCVAENIGNGVGAAGFGFYFTGLTNGLVKPITVSGSVARGCTQDGFYIVSITDVSIHNCTADSNTRNGFNAGAQGKRALWSGCRSTRNTGAGFVTISDDGTFNGCSAVGNVSSNGGFLCQGNRQTLSGCSAVGQTSRGFLVNAGSGHTLTGCTGAANGAEGIFLQNVSYVTVTGGHWESNATYGMRISTGRDFNTIANNVARLNTTANYIYSLPATTDYMHANQGYNPIGPFGSGGFAPANPAVPASTVVQTNTFGFACSVAISGGTVTVIAVAGTATGLTSGTFRVPPGSTIAVTYSAAPAWQWYGD